MIPKQMHVFLRERLPQQTFENRLVRDNGKCFLEFGTLDDEYIIANSYELILDDGTPSLMRVPVAGSILT